MKKNSLKQAKYERLYDQLSQLFLEKRNNKASRMASIVALLHHKMSSYSWTGFYLLDAENELMVNTYQGTLACMHLKKNTGVCWTAINQAKTIIVDDVEHFSGHIACCSLTRSEIVVPLFNEKQEVWGCLDVDSQKLANFDRDDQLGLEKIITLIS